jgi:hypothetical protein
LLSRKPANKRIKSDVRKLAPFLRVVSLEIELDSPRNQSQNHTMEGRLHFGPYYPSGL